MDRIRKKPLIYIIIGASVVVVATIIIVVCLYVTKVIGPKPSYDNQEKRARSFKFSDQEISRKDVGILHYNEGGSYTLYNLSSGLIPLEPKEDIKIIIHGFQSSGSEDWIKEMAMAYHRTAIKNTISIDWKVLANQGYDKTASITKPLGRLVANWLYSDLLKSNSADLERVHLIGHSLGAHISGFTGKRILEITKGQTLVGRISGLDAAAPLFELPSKLPTSLRLFKGDAKIVEGYHTNIGFLGFASAIGNRDYYISTGGGCGKLFLTEKFKCSHALAYKIFTKSIESKNYLPIECGDRLQFQSNKCENNRRVLLGEHADKDIEGIFYMNTDDDGNPEEI